jgi:hypothetical protein
MATRRNVTSVDAIQDFRASLIVYISKARPTLEEVNAEVTRTRAWLQGTQRVSWEGIAKKRARILEEAKANLFSAKMSKMSNLRDVTSAEMLAVTKAKRAFDEAEEKLRVIRRWDRDFDNRTEPLARQLEKLHSILSEDLGQAVHYLTEVVKTLNQYAGMVAPSLEAEASQTSVAKTDDAASVSIPPGDAAPGHKGGGS